MLDKLRSLNIVTQKNQINKQAKRMLQKHLDVLSELIKLTEFLPPECSVRERIYCIQFNITKHPVCKVCGTPVTFNKAKGQFNQYCPNVRGRCCAANDPQLQQARTQTIVDRYGVPNVSQNENIKGQKKQTNRTRYGGNAPISSKKVKQQMDNTNIQRYGTTTIATLPKVKQKRAQTLQNRYGAKTFAESRIPLEIRDKLKNKKWLTDEYIFKNKTIKQISDEISTSVYSVRQALKTFEIQKKNVDLDLHVDGVNIPEHLPDLLKNRAWLHEQYCNRNISRTTIAEALGITATYVDKWRKQHQLRVTTNQTVQSSGERALCSVISTLGVPFQTNVKTIISPYEIDIFVPSHNLAIEYCGTLWHSEKNGNKDRTYHLRKHQLCKQKQIHLVQIWSSEWIKKQQIVKSRISSLLGYNTKIYARNCIIQEISPSVSREFQENHHIQGFCGGQCHYGLVHQETLVAVMVFGLSRFRSDHSWELIRFASASGTNVVGGASKLFKHFRNTHPHVRQIISYSDNRWNTGHLYHNLGFVLKHQTTPNYFYFVVNGDTNELYSRIRYQKHKLSNMLSNFDPSLSEWQNMVNNGYDRIWDCGNSVWQYSV